MKRNKNETLLKSFFFGNMRSKPSTMTSFWITRRTLRKDIEDSTYFKVVEKVFRFKQITTIKYDPDRDNGHKFVVQ